MNQNKDFKVGDRVVPHSCNPQHFKRGLANSIAWGYAIEKGQPYLFINRVPEPSDDHNEYLLNEEPVGACSMFPINGDLFKESDFSLYVEPNF